MILHGSLVGAEGTARYKAPRRRLLALLRCHELGFILSGHAHQSRPRAFRLFQATVFTNARQAHRVRRPTRVPAAKALTSWSSQGTLQPASQLILPEF
jgi:hypothetical protein